MHTLRLLIPMLTLAFLAACATKPGPAPIGPVPAVAASETDIFEVMRAHRDWRYAFNSRDPARLAAAYDPEAVLWDLDATMSVGNISGTGGAAIARHFADMALRKGRQIKDESGGHGRRHGDLGIITGVYTLTESIDGNEVSRRVAYTSVFRKRDGVWLMYAQHLSLLP